MAVATNKLPPNCRPLYRILTEKSKLGFGKYADFFVGDILKIDEPYIVWLYCSHPQISLHKDILDSLGLPQIQKPGVDDEVRKEWNRKRASQYTREEKENYHYHLYRKNKRKAISKMIQVRKETNYSKGQLQAINQGHGNPKSQ